MCEFSAYVAFNKATNGQTDKHESGRVPKCTATTRKDSDSLCLPRLPHICQAMVGEVRGENRIWMSREGRKKVGRCPVSRRSRQSYTLWCTPGLARENLWYPWAPTRARPTIVSASRGTPRRGVSRQHQMGCADETAQKKCSELEEKKSCPCSKYGWCLKFVWL